MALLKQFDLVAVQPTNEKVLVQACQYLDIDVIYFDLTQRLPFPLKFQPIGVAIDRGVMFELGFASTLKGRPSSGRMFT